MRNTTKLKHILQLYSIAFDMDDEGVFTLTMTHKQTLEMNSFQGKTYSDVLSKCYSYFLKKINPKSALPQE
jgi:hypothetical protein